MPRVLPRKRQEGIHHGVPIIIPLLPLIHPRLIFDKVVSQRRIFGAHLARRRPETSLRAEVINISSLSLINGHARRISADIVIRRLICKQTTSDTDNERCRDARERQPELVERCGFNVSEVVRSCASAWPVGAVSTMVFDLRPISMQLHRLRKRTLNIATTTGLAIPHYRPRREVVSDAECHEQQNSSGND